MITFAFFLQKHFETGVINCGKLYLQVPAIDQRE